MAYIVYKVFGSKDPHSYYGYCREELDPLQQFIKQSSRTEDERGDVRLLQLNDNNPELLQLKILDVYEEEFDAWVIRNEFRSHEVDAITGPTNFPISLHNRAKKDLPKEKLEGWKKMLAANNAKTARQAWALGKWSNQTIKSLTEKFDKNQIIKDLDKLSPFDFNQLYLPNILSNQS